jgi:hypothetical protein
MTIFASQSGSPQKFTGQHFMFVPIETPRYGGLIILSGLASINFAGDSDRPVDWRFDRVILDLDVDFGKAIRSAPYALSSPLQQFVGFSIAQAVPFATVNARSARLNPTPTLADDGTAVRAFWSGPGGATIQIEVGAMGTRTVIHRLGYHLSLYGHLVVSGVVEGEASTSQAGALATAASTAQVDASADSMDM